MNVGSPKLPGRPSRDFVASASAATIYSFALAISSVGLPLLALGAGYSAAQVGILAAISAVSQLLTRLTLGAVMRRYGDWTLIASSALILAVSNGLAALSASAISLVLAELLQGVSRAFFWTGTQTHVVRRATSAAAALAAINLVSSTGLLAGPAVAGMLSEHTPVLALNVAAGVSLLGCGPAFFLDRLPPFVPPADKQPGRMYRRPGVALGCWGGFSAGAWRGVLGSYVPVALDLARQSASTIGILVSVANAAALVGSGVAGRIRAHAFRKVILIGMVAMGVATAAVPALASLIVPAALALIVSGVAAGLVQVLSLATASDAVHPEERGEAIAISGTFRAAALFVAPLAVAAMVLVIPLAAAVAVVGTAMTAPALALRSRSPGDARNS